ncbi:hypothetical protein KQX54_017462 [Cotesia glomerata]|uniref:Uncharacterized protein n=1 Tax=Cotesia glomerata TaxID=32391 RepID=A0AAV7HXY5_COTGL|nr:hypothetical protein KQX54_017462 [Cotesia glomerata]
MSRIHIRQRSRRKTGSLNPPIIFSSARDSIILELNSLISLPEQKRSVGVGGRVLVPVLRDINIDSATDACLFSYRGIICGVGGPRRPLLCGYCRNSRNSCYRRLSPANRIPHGPPALAAASPACILSNRHFLSWTG